ncbi:MAG: response regulator transcription factor [Planctomycetota bacterium]|jgi:DNA-binding NarL/FixJ family response regulator|nr:response regulator transcription factor [Planctomycetota bacterium]MDP7251956.1 response regulator transcription factor [Planctomycetota bacterium]
MIATETAEARILLVDDHPMLRHGLASYINQQEGLLVCGEAENLEQGLSRIESLDPGLVIVDITLRGSDGIELIRRIRADGNQVPILVLSMHDESLYAERVLRTGANGYIMKEEAREKVIEAIKQVLDGGTWVSPRVASLFVERTMVGQTPGRSPLSHLSNRELEVFRLIGKGFDTRTIAAELGISGKTVDVHRANIKKKLGMKRLSELVRYAVNCVESRDTD